MICIKLLFICSRNKWWSLTAEKIFHGVNGYDVRSAGTEANARIKVTDGHIGWADIVFVMEKKHSSRLKIKFGELLNNKKIICLLSIKKNCNIVFFVNKSKKKINLSKDDYF